MKKRRKNAKRILTDQQKRAAQLLFDGHGIVETAAIIGVHRTTLWRWEQLRAFQREIDRCHDDWLKNYRREARKKYRQSEEYKRKKAAEKKLLMMEKIMEEAAEKASNGDLKALERAQKEYDIVFNEAYFGGLTPYQYLNSTFNLEEKKRQKKQVKYIIEFVK